MNKRNIESIYPLSPMQQGMLFHSLRMPDSGVYVEQLSCTLKGDLDITSFENAWKKVIERHPVLRTSFSWKTGDKMLQIVQKQVEIPFEYVDWRGMAGEEQETRLEEFLIEERRKGFDLAKAPVMRLALMRISDQAFYFHWCFHHALIDGWSLPIIMKEVLALYEAFSHSELEETGINKTALNLPDPKPYRDYIQWLNRQEESAAESFWSKTLAGFYSPTPLLAKSDLVQAKKEPEQILQENYGFYDSIQISLSAETTNHLNIIARQNQLTISTILMGAWAVVLSRYTSETDVMFGATVSGRPTDLFGAESMVGLFINTIPVRCKVDPRISVLDLLKVLQAQVVEARQYEYTPLVKVHEWSKLPGGTQLFDHIFIFENYPVDKALKERVGSITIEDIRSLEQTNYPLAVVSGPGEELPLKMSFDYERLDRSVVRNLLEHLKVVLTHFADNPEGLIGGIDLLTQSERSQILLEWNNIDYRPIGEIHTIPELFEKMVQEVPDELALFFEGQELSYRELNARVNQLAHYLRALGVGPETIVALCVERSLEMMIGLLGIIKAGGAYLPIDPSLPSDRIHFMQEDSQAAFTITQSKLLPKFQQATGQIVLLDEDWSSIQLESTENPPVNVDPENLVYVIYTSGSTGLPKGTMLHHRGVCNFGLAYSNFMQLRSTDRVLQFASISFDASVAEIFSAFFSGAALSLIDREIMLSEQSLLEHLRKTEITFAILPPTMLMMIEPVDLPALRRLMSAGEACTPDVVRKWGNGRHFYNGYGPTEVTVGPTIYKVAQLDDNHGTSTPDRTGTSLEQVPLNKFKDKPGQANTGQRIPIGKAIDNIQAYIMDEEYNLVPAGVVGELYLSGVGVARGYLGRPDLTAERFIPNPLIALSNANLDLAELPSDCFCTRLYRTGDLARYRKDGNIEFIDRVDYQVKIRGLRIELGEIEATLQSHPEIEEAVVIAREDNPANKQLVAYYTCSSSDDGIAEPEVGDLREYLRQFLPEYMIPSAFVSLVEFPLTPSNKVDRKALPAPDESATVGRTFVAPRTPMEELLANIFAQVLGVAHVGIYDNFFELGGHSLLVTQVVSRIRNAANVEIPIQELFEAPTVAEMAVRVGMVMQSSAGIELPPISKIDRDPGNGLPIEAPELSFSQQRLWFLDQLAPGNLFYNIPLAVRLKGELDIQALEWSLNQIIKRHAILRTTFQSQAGKPVQIIAPYTEETGFSIQVEDFTGEEQSEIFAIARAQEEARTPFDLEQGPLLRARLIKLDPSTHIFVLVMHHIISDGWSMGVFIQELVLHYASYMHSQGISQVSSEQLDLQYFDYAHWQRQWLQGEVLERQLEYWKKQLANQPKMLNLPTDRPRPAIQSSAGDTIYFSLPANLSQALLDISKNENVTLYMTLLAAFQILLYRYSSQEDISVGTAIANRKIADTESLIGFFVNTLVMRTDLSGRPSFRGLLKRVREVTLGAYAHQDLPFEMIVETLAPERDLSHTPLFQVAFSLQNMPTQTVLKEQGFSHRAGKATQSMDISSISEMFSITSPMNEPDSPGEQGVLIQIPEQVPPTEPGPAWNKHQARPGQAGLWLEPITVNAGTSQFDMMLTISETPAGLKGAFEYNVDLFNRSTIQRMIGHFQTLLGSIIENPDLPITDLEILTTPEWQQIIHTWNQTEALTPVDRCAHQLFEEHVAENPDAIAVTYEGTTLTYAALERKANQLAHYLRQLGIGPEVIVGLSTRRSPEMIIGIFGVLKAGGAYLPLDPTYPMDRLAFMIEDSKIPVLLTQADLVENLPLGAEQDLMIVRLDQDWEQYIAEMPDTAPDKTPAGSGQVNTGFASHVTPENLAYVIYTSGSTGLPKGTMLRHKGLSNLTAAQREAFSINRDSKILQFSPLSFDASVWETFMALANGATLVLAPQEVLSSGDSLARLVMQEDITNVTLPPSVMRVIPQESFLEELFSIDNDGQEDMKRTDLMVSRKEAINLRSLRTMIAAGEACTPELVSRWAKGRDFFNAYGPTETTVCASMYLCDENEPDAPPIGRPILNTRLYILDASLQPVPVGVPGELHVAGVSLARGYLHRPETTAQKFVPDPFSKAPGEFLYKTGDLVRYLENGNIEFLGRIDQQVKVRGFRIEIGEIEAALGEYPGLLESVVILREDSPGDKRLVAYLAPSYSGESDQGVNIGELRQFLRQTLPDYMIPSMFVILETMPHSPSGKIDRVALPIPEADRSILESEYIAPRNEIEQDLANIAAELLNIERVGVFDNFFELGGHSLLATQFISRIREKYEVDLPLRALFENPTIAAIQERIEGLRQELEQSTDLPGAQIDEMAIAEMLQKVDQLSEEEVKALLEKLKSQG